MTLLRRKLREAREARVRPGKDDKIIAAWNGIMISALARGYQVLGEERFREAAERAARFVLTEMVRDGVLLRTYRSRGDGGVSKLPAYLDDYAEIANGLLDLYEATFDLQWLEAADQLAGRMVTDFWDDKNGGFFYTSASHKNLLARTKPFYDGAVPSGNSTATFVLLRLSALVGNAGYGQKAEAVFASAGEMMLAHPRGYLNLLGAADFFLYPTREIAIAGKPDSADTRRFLEVIHDRFIPNKILALVEPGASGSAAVEERIPLLRHKGMISGKATIYVCRNHNCKLPVTDEAALVKVLGEPDALPNKTDGKTTTGESRLRRD